MLNGSWCVPRGQGKGRCLGHELLFPALRKTGHGIGQRSVCSKKFGDYRHRTYRRLVRSQLAGTLLGGSRTGTVVHLPA